MIGPDTLDKIKSPKVLKQALVCIINRKLNEHLVRQVHKFEKQLVLIRDEGNQEQDLSSTLIRLQIQKGLSVDSNLLPPTLVSYINENKLYYVDHKKEEQEKEEKRRVMREAIDKLSPLVTNCMSFRLIQLE